MTARPIKSQELLRLAQALAPAAAGPGRPRTVWLRRAVSTAYYALFHELVDQATRELCGSEPAVAAQRLRAARWFAHSDVKALAEVVARSRSSGPQAELSAVLGEPHSDLVLVADVFLDLQRRRHKSDYDHEYDLPRREALLMVQTAADTIERVRSLRKNGDPSYLRFMRMMVGAVKIAQTRRA